MSRRRRLCHAKAAGQPQACAPRKTAGQVPADMAFHKRSAGLKIEDMVEPSSPWVYRTGPSTATFFAKLPVIVLVLLGHLRLRLNSVSYGNRRPTAPGSGLATTFKAYVWSIKVRVRMAYNLALFARPSRRRWHSLGSQDARAAVQDAGCVRPALRRMSGVLPRQLPHGQPPASTHHVDENPCQSHRKPKVNEPDRLHPPSCGSCLKTPAWGHPVYGRYH